MSLTPKEAEIAIVFMNRVELKGSESEAHAMLKMKLGQIRDAKPAEVVDIDKLNGASGQGTTED